MKEKKRSPRGGVEAVSAQQEVSQQANRRRADSEDEFAGFADVQPGHQQRIHGEEQGERAEGQSASGAP